MIYLWGGILVAFLGVATWGYFHGESRYEDGKTDCNNEWVAKGVEQKALEKARNEALAEQSAADAKAVGARVDALAAVIRKGRENSAQPVKIVKVFPPGCKATPEAVREVNK